MLFCKQQQASCEYHIQTIWFKPVLSLAGSQKQKQIHYFQGNICSEGFILWVDIILPSHCFFLILQARRKEKKVPVWWKAYEGWTHFKPAEKDCRKNNGA